ncbi:MAG: hypothetical protein ACYCUG_16920 [Acidimicrobiales bacterium]
MTGVVLESGARWVFASAVDWPGWARRGKGEDAALAALDAYAGRYRAVAARAGVAFGPDKLDVVGRVESGAIVDFGAPGAPAPWDAPPLPPEERACQVALLQAAWSAFDAGVSTAPPALRKGPRGGGRDRDGIVDHVREAERAYGRKIGVRVAPRTPWEEQRAAIASNLLGGEPPTAAGSLRRWPPRYFLRRTAWHVTDHLWEIEDRGEP